MQFWQLLYSQRALLAFALVLGTAACGDDDDTDGDVDTAEELTPGTIPDEVAAVDGPEVSAADAQAALAMNDLPEITDPNGSAAIAQGRSVTSQFSTVFQYAGSGAAAPGYVPQAVNESEYTINGVTFKYIWSDEGDSYTFKSTVSGTSTESGQVFTDVEWYTAEVLKNRRSGRVRMDYTAFWDIYNNADESGTDYEGEYVGYYILEESGKLSVVWNSHVNLTSSGQNFVYNYDGSVAIEADKSGQAEWEYDVNVGAAGANQSGDGCSKWDTAGVVSAC